MLKAEAVSHQESNLTPLGKIGLRRRLEVTAQVDGDTTAAWAGAFLLPGDH
jgi:hypothetical protein